MTDDEPITELYASDPLQVVRDGQRATLTIADSPAVFVKITDSVDDVIDADGNSRTAYRGRKQDAIGGGDFADSADLVEYFKASDSPAQQPIFFAGDGKAPETDDIFLIYPGVRDSNPDPDENHGLEWFIKTDAVELPPDASYQIRGLVGIIASGFTQVLGDGDKCFPADAGFGVINYNNDPDTYPTTYAHRVGLQYYAGGGAMSPHTAGLERGINLRRYNDAGTFVGFGYVGAQQFGIFGPSPTTPNLPAIMLEGLSAGGIVDSCLIHAATLSSGAQTLRPVGGIGSVYLWADTSSPGPGPATYSYEPSANFLGNLASQTYGPGPGGIGPSVPHGLASLFINGSVITHLYHVLTGDNDTNSPYFAGTGTTSFSVIPGVSAHGLVVAVNGIVIGSEAVNAEEAMFGGGSPGSVLQSSKLKFPGGVPWWEASAGLWFTMSSGDH